MAVAIKTPSYYGLGPYYQQERIEAEARREALGGQAINPAALAAERYGEMSAYLGEAKQLRTELRAERELKMKERAEKRQEKTETVKGVATGASTGLAIGSAVSAAATAAEGAGTGIMIGAGTVLPFSFLGPIGLILGAASAFAFGKK